MLNESPHLDFANFSVLFESATSRVNLMQAVIDILQGISQVLKMSDNHLDEYHSNKYQQDYKRIFSLQYQKDNKKISVKQYYAQNFRKIVASLDTNFLEISRYFL